MSEDSGRLAAIEDTQAEHTTALRAIGEKLDRVLEILTPPDSPGPTLDEILAQLVTVISDQTAILRRLDGRTAAMAERMGVDEVEPSPPPSAASRAALGGARPAADGHDAGGGHPSDDEPPA